MRAKQKIRIRKSTKIIYTCIAIVMLLVSAVNLFSILSKRNVVNNQKEIYSYTNKFDYKYRVNLLKNKYIEEETLDMNKPAYVTKLIDTMDFDINYSYEGETESDIQYKYSIIGNLEATYTEDDEEQKILEKEYVLKDEVVKTSNDGKIEIKEDINLNLKEENNLVKDFEQNMGMTLDAKYIINLKVTSTTQVEGENITNDYVSSIVINLAKKTTKIDGENNKEETQYVTKELKEVESISPIKVIFDIIGITLAILILKYLSRTKNINTIRNKYRQELNKILRICQEKIVKVRNKPIIREESIVDVRDFGEIIKLSEELFKPILYWESKEDEAWFIVMSNDIVYRFILSDNQMAN